MQPIEGNEGFLQIPFQAEDGTEVNFYVLEQTKFYGFNYLLVTDNAESEEADAYVLKELPGGESEDSIYEMVQDEKELSIVAKLFEESMEDVDII